MDFAMSLIHIARKLYARESFTARLEQTVHAAPDTTTIDLCLNVLVGMFRSTKVAVKLHTLLYLRNNTTFTHIRDGKMHKVNVLDILIAEVGSFHIMDRGFTRFSHWLVLHQTQVFFIIRSKSNLLFRRTYSRTVEKSTELCCNQTIGLTTPKAKLIIHNT